MRCILTGKKKDGKNGYPYTAAAHCCCCLFHVRYHYTIDSVTKQLLFAEPTNGVLLLM